MAEAGLWQKIRARASRTFDRIAKALRRPIRMTFFGRTEKGPQMRTGDFRSYIGGLFQSEWAMAGVMRIVDAIMFHSWTIKDADDNVVEDRSLRVYTIFERPNPTQTWVDFIEAIIWFWIPLGNVFIWKRPNILGEGGPAQLWVLWPDTIEIIPDETGRSVKEYKVLEEGNKFTVPREQMLHIRFGNPSRRHWGLGRIEAAERVYDMDIAAGEYAINYFNNDATPGGVLSSPKRIHPETRQALKDEWNERHRGEHRAHNWTLLEDGVTWMKTNDGPREALFIETRKTTREAILAMLGVTPEKVGLLENSNKSTSFVSERSWQRDTIAPLLKRLDIFLTTVAKEFGPYRFEFEELVQEDAVEDTTIAAGYFNLGAITPNEVRTIYAGLPAIEDNPAMDVTYLSVGSVETGETPPPVGFSIDPSNPGAMPQPTNGDGNGKAKGYIPLTPGLRPQGETTHGRASGRTDGKTDGRRKADEPDKKPPKGTPVQRRVLNSFRKQQIHQARVMRRKIAAFFREQGGKVISRLLNGKGADFVGAAVTYYTNGKYADASLTLKKGIEDIFDLAADEQAWNLTVRGMFGEALQEEYQVTATLIGDPGGIPFGPGDGAFEGRLNRLAAKVTRVSEGTKSVLEELISTGVQAGESPVQMANSIRDSFEEMAQSRAQLIARTESSRALDQANTALYRRLGVETVDVIGCEDSVIMPGQRWGCNSQGVPASEAAQIEFHPNHKGAIVPRVASASRLAALFDTKPGRVG